MLNRESWIDTIRSFACICVITTHAPIPNSSNGLIFGSIFNYFSTAGASILFFMISGALILYKEMPIIPFLKKRLLRIFLPMVIWSIISLFVQYLSEDLSANELISKIILIPFVPQIGNYWFIYTILGIYIITPLISTWLSHCTQQDVRFYLIIWGITLCIPYLSLINPCFETMISYSGGWLYYMYGYIGFVILGYYLRKYTHITFQPKYIIVVLAIILIPLLLYMIPSIPHTTIQNRMSINIVLLAICYFLAIKQITLSPKLSKIVYNFAQHSFGIYLIHILVMREVIWPILEPYDINYIIQIPLIVVLTTIISYAIVHLISRTPYSKYIIGL